MTKKTLQLTLAAALALPLMAWAGPGHDAGHGDGHGKTEAHASAAGKPGDPAKVSRTIDVNMSDNMRFDPAQVQVKAGETIRFRVINKGVIPHEMVIGSMKELDAHADMMKKMPGMEHAEPNQVTLDGGKSGDLVWTFDKAGTFTFACLIPGHKEAGMVGQLTVQP